MSRDDIIRMAREAGFVDASFCRWSAYTDDLERFAALVAALSARRGEPTCPHIRSSGPADRATHWCALAAAPPAAPSKLVRPIGDRTRLPADAREAMTNVLRWLTNEKYVQRRYMESSACSEDANKHVDALRRALAEPAAPSVPAYLLNVVEQILDDGHLHTQTLAQLRAAYESAEPAAPTNKEEK